MKIILTGIAGAIILFAGCNTDNIHSITGIEVRHENQPDELFVGSTFEFQVIGNNSTDVTSESVIEVNGTEIDGNTFTTSSEPAEYEVKAYYKDFVSDPIHVRTGNGFVKNVLIEDYTGTWCGWCPRVAYAIVLAKEQSNQVVGVAVHQNSESEPDPFVCDASTALGETFGVNGLPEARLNRIHTWSAPENENIDEALSFTGFSPVGIAVQSQLEGNQIQAQIKVKFSQDVTTPVNVVVYLLESGMLYDQTNYTHDLFSEGYENPLPDFQHNDVLRAVYTGLLGNEIPAAETHAGNVYTLDILEDLPASIEDSSQLSVVAFVTDASTDEVINVREAPVGEEQDFQTGEQ